MKKNYKVVSFILAMIMIISVFSAFSYTKQNGTVASSSAKIYESAIDSSRVLAVLNKGEDLNIIGKTQNFYLVIKGSITGFMLKSAVIEEASYSAPDFNGFYFGDSISKVMPSAANNKATLKIERNNTATIDVPHTNNFATRKVTYNFSYNKLTSGSDYVLYQEMNPMLVKDSVFAKMLVADFWIAYDDLNKKFGAPFFSLVDYPTKLNNFDDVEKFYADLYDDKAAMYAAFKSSEGNVYTVSCYARFMENAANSNLTDKTYQKPPIVHGTAYASIEQLRQDLNS